MTPKRTWSLVIIASRLIALTDGLQFQSILDPSAVPTGAEFTRLLAGAAARFPGGGK